MLETTRRQAIGLGIGLAAASLAGCGSQASPQDADPAGPKEGDRRTVRLICTSDLHGKMLPWDYAADAEDGSGSMAQLKTAIASVRDERSILVDVGDTIQDNSADLFLDEAVHPMLACINNIGYDVGVLGNHEFNYGMDVVRSYVDGFDGTMLTGNVIDERGDAVAEAYTVLEREGLRVGIIGMVTSNIVRWDRVNLEGCTVSNAVEEARKAIDEIADDVDILVAAVHMGLDDEYEEPGSSARELAEACPELDVILAAHHHTLVEGELIGDTLAVENKSQAQTLVVVDVTCAYEDGRWRVATKESHGVDVGTFEPDPGIELAMEPFDERAKAHAHEPVGTLVDGPLAPASEVDAIPTAVLQDTAMIDLINDAQLHYSGADVSATSLMSTTAGMDPGEVRRCDIAKIYRYANTLYMLRMTGAQLRTYLEWSAAFYLRWKPGDLTLGFDPKRAVYECDMLQGVSYTVDVSQEAGSRIRDLALPDGTPVADDDSFTVAVSNYRANTQLLSPGTVFEEGDLPELLEIDVRGELGSVREMIVDYIENVLGGTITPTTDDSWHLTGYSWDEDKHAQAIELIRSGKIAFDEGSQWRALADRAITEDDLEG